MIQARFVLPGIVDGVAATALKSELVFHYYCGRALTLDASGVEHIGRPELILLWSAAESFASAGLDLFIDAPSPAFITAFKDVAAAA